MRETRPTRLEARHTAGAGWEIFAHIQEDVKCVEFDMIGGHPHMIATSRWVQFAPPAWKEMNNKIFPEMVAAWNEKHATEKGPDDG
jgi:hypothetical protein